MTPHRSLRSTAAIHGAHPVRRVRPASPHCGGGVSSMLRLASQAPERLPGAPALGAWMSHAARVLMPVTGPLGALGPLAQRNAGFDDFNAFEAFESAANASQRDAA